MKAIIGLIQATADFFIKTPSDHILMAQYKTSSAQKLNAIIPMHGKEMVAITMGGRTRYYSTSSTEYCSVKKRMGTVYNSFYMGVVIDKQVGEKYFITTKEHVKTDLFNYLVNNHKYALLPEWKDYLFDSCMEKGYLCDLAFCVKADDMDSYIPIGGSVGVAKAKDVVVYNVSVSDTALRNIISSGLQHKRIRISDKVQSNRVVVDSLDSYMYTYNDSISKHMEEHNLKPKFPLKRDVDGLALKNRKLKSPQAACVNGIVATMQEKKDDFCLVVQEMGCGKTVQSLAAVEAYFNQKWLRQHPGKTLVDCFNAKEVSYRVAVMCPAHLPEKWKAEIESQIPFAKVTIVTELRQLVSLRNRRKQRNGKEIYIFSKEFAKADSIKRPVPTKIRKRSANTPICVDCLIASSNAYDEQQLMRFKNEKPFDRNELAGLGIMPMYMDNGVLTCHRCGGHNSHLMSLKSYGKHEGLVCPECDNLLLSKPHIPVLRELESEDFEDLILQPADFAGKTTVNARCQCCGAQLWEDNVVSMDISTDICGFSKMEPSGRESKWKKIKFYSDYAKTQKGDGKMNKSAYTLPGYEMSTVEKCGVIINPKVESMDLDPNIDLFELKKKASYCDADRTTGPRKTSPARYAKKYLKGAFDVLIADECHQYEGIRTEQSIAMHSLSKISNFKILMTGTITNGTALSLFCIFFMIMPGEMRKRGYTYTPEGMMQFARDYGVVETEYEYNEGVTAFKKQGRGRQIKSPTVRAGISVLMYPHFLTNHSVMLNIGDMCNHMPELKEHVIECEMPQEVQNGYDVAMREIKDALQDSDGEIGKGLVGTMLQYGLSYPDKPYGREPIYSLKVSDTIVVSPCNNEKYATVEELLPKEKELIKIVNQEISEGRNVFVYTYYSNKEETNVNFRFKEIIEKHCNLEGHVAVLESTKVKSVDREEYIKKHSDKIKVWITNYANVETGIDFCGNYRGRDFNYPSIVFMQVGMSLSSVWQASRRSYRLSQKSECRTYFLVYKNCFQKDILEMMSKKISAASAIQGNFSESALENMMGAEDPQVVLAKKLTSGNTNNEDVDVEELLAKTRNNIVADCDESGYIGGEAHTYYEIINLSDGIKETTVEKSTEPKVETSFSGVLTHAVTTQFTTFALTDDCVEGKNGQLSFF